MFIQFTLLFLKQNPAIIDIYELKNCQISVQGLWLNILLDWVLDISLLNHEYLWSNWGCSWEDSFDYFQWESDDKAHDPRI